MPVALRSSFGCYRTNAVRRARSASRLLGDQVARAHRMSADVQACLQQVAPDVFASLSSERQHRLLLYPSTRFDLMGGPLLARFLKRQFEEVDSRLDPDAQESQRSLILSSIHQMDPALEQDVVRQEIALPRPRVRNERLVNLPDATLPELDQLFATQLLETWELGDPEAFRCEARAHRTVRHGRSSAARSSAVRERIAVAIWSRSALSHLFSENRANVWESARRAGHSTRPIGQRSP